ncbi:MAG TPA: DUF362 domain-containing protein [Planctomycetota bacterium]|nr:DUF362 domain-containing protein [Planctomycetota bacterium]OQC22115.1 MAG: hypothetical protein BWX69_00426 [Planctomycetes bacterium ADurb.Bin069]HNS00375.1 DUF362 domain-containing protein [Planctomycetota bacterium]HNU25751.1 DUF362 domain-containing protein [Planctomycetota bacterium]HOE28695.1 DUF362 domain-containing protein [Planctomycetota bacterium]
MEGGVARRREFLHRCAATAAAGAVGGGLAWWAYGRQRPPRPADPVSLAGLDARFPRPDLPGAPVLVVARDTAIADPRGGPVEAAVIERMLVRALEPLGTMARFVPRGGSVLIKPNAAFAADPLSGAIADPRTIAAVVKSALAAGAGEVLVADNPIAAPAFVFDRSGIAAAVAAAGGRVVLPDERGFAPVRIPGATTLPPWPAFTAVLARADAVIGIAPVKDHNLCGASLTMKNWYGLLGGNRSQFHQHIHEVICDLWRLMRPAAPLLILDGTRVLMRNGPTGGSAADVVVRNTLAVGTDPVAIDAFGVTLLGRDPRGVKYLVEAEAAGFGTLEFERRMREV